MLFIGGGVFLTQCRYFVPTVLQDNVGLSRNLSLLLGGVYAIRVSIYQVSDVLTLI